nr:hypothetical protein GCM10020093_051440 [Planobispora longispora]
MPSRAILAIGAVGFCATFAEGASQNWAAVYVKDVTGGGAGVAAACYALFSLAMAVTRLSGDPIVRRLGPVPAARFGGLLATAGAVLVATARTPFLAVAGFVLLGVGVAVIAPLAFAAGERDPGARPGGRGDRHVHLPLQSARSRGHRLDRPRDLAARHLRPDRGRHPDGRPARRGPALPARPARGPRR